MSFNKYVSQCLIIIVTCQRKRGKKYFIYAKIEYRKEMDKKAIFKLFFETFELLKIYFEKRKAA